MSGPRENPTPPLMAQLILRRRADHGVEVLLNVPGMAAAEGKIEAQALRATLEIFDQSEQGEAAVVLPRRGGAEGTEDIATNRREEELGSRLGKLLEEASPAVNNQLRKLLGRAEERRQALILGVDVEDRDLQRLPWELIGLPHGLEAEGKAVVVRLVPGQAARGRAALPTVLHSLRWVPDPEAEEVAAILAGLPAPSDPPRDSARLLHMVCHGSLLDDEMVWVGDGRRRHVPGEAIHALQPLLEDAAVVICHTCHSGAPAPEQLADRAIRAGARVVLAPVEEISVEASLAFSDSFAGELARGRSVSGALVEGRRAVLALHDPGAQARWWKLRCFVSDGSELGPVVRPLGSAPRPDGDVPPLVLETEIADLRRSLRPLSWAVVGILVLAGASLVVSLRSGSEPSETPSSSAPDFFQVPEGATVIEKIEPGSMPLPPMPTPRGAPAHPADDPAEDPAEDVAEDVAEDGP